MGATSYPLPAGRGATREATSGWEGDHVFLLINLIKKDFKVRYRNMSLGVLWSLANPLVMMSVLTFIFTQVFKSSTAPEFALFALTGLVPFNFFSIAWLTGTVSIVENAALIKRVQLPRELVPVATVLAAGLHFLIQVGLLIAFVLAFGKGANAYWLWLPFIMTFEVVFVCGLALAFSALDVYIRDTKYVVESSNVVLFWLVPILYPFSMVPMAYKEIYQLNPVAAVVLAFRNVLLEGKMPPESLLLKLMFSSTLVLLLGLLVFRRLRRRFFDHL